MEGMTVLEAEKWLSNFPRLSNLYNRSQKGDSRNYFNFEELIPWAGANFAELEKTLSKLDAESWERLCAKTLSAVNADHRFRRYQQLFNHLNEAKGYEFLLDQGYTEIEFIQPSRSESPDLRAIRLSSTANLEVKTINESNENLGPDALWKTEAVSVPRNLSTEFKSKIVSTIEQARRQLNSYPSAVDRKIVFLIIRLDHGQKTAWHLYSELKQFVASQSKDGIEVFHKPEL
jgi:hypothetical protein